MAKSNRKRGRKPPRRLRRAAKSRPRAAKRPARSRARKPSSKARPTKRAAPKKKTRPSRQPKAIAARGRTLTPLTLGRNRRRLSDAERLESGRMVDPQIVSAARAGHDELKSRLTQHTESDPSLTAGDIDAKWEDAYAVGDEAPGGDNPTPDQTRVDDIGRALGIEYQDNEELKGSDKVARRDHHRWELDPASSEDWPHEGEEEQ